MLVDLRAASLGRRRDAVNTKKGTAVPNDDLSAHPATAPNGVDRALRAPSGEDIQPIGAEGALLFVACTLPVPGTEEVALALKPLEDGRLAMLVFTSLDSLVAGCGDEQPWVALTEARIEDAFQRSAADVVAIDAGLTTEQRWGTGNEPLDLAAYRSAQTAAKQEGA
jgi:hypothetical protein